MKKRIFSVALLAMSLFAVNGVAQNPANNSNSTQIENVKGKKMEKKGERAKKNPYEGLNLTDAQKAKLQQLDEKQAAQRKQQMEEMKAERKQQKEAQKADKQRNEQARKEARKAAKKEYLEEVKAIIGPDQYVVFLENFYINGGYQGGKQMKQAPRDGKNFAKGKDMKGKKGEGRKDGKKGDRQKSGNKGSKNGAQANATTAQL